MKKFSVFLPMIVFFFFAFVTTAQDIQGGKVVYERLVDYKLEGVYDDPRWDSYIADLPKQGKSIHQLSFTMNYALYEEDTSQKETMSSHLKTALYKANYDKTPKPKVKKIYYDFNKKELTEQKEFMTRDFLVASDFERKAWKLTARKKKILDYICFGADLQVGEETITAWFTSEIPVSAGPDAYYGLPGLILGLEKNEEIFVLATSVDLTAPEESTLTQMGKGQKLSQEKFDQIVEEKTEEYEKAVKMKGGEKSKGRN